MAHCIRIYRSGESIHEATGETGESLLGVIGTAGIFLDSPCGGQGKCGKCRVRLSPDGEEVLACRTLIDGDMDVYLPDNMEMKIADGGARAAEATTGAETRAVAETAEKTAAGGRYGIAVDIGTTTVVAHLTDIATGARLATASGVNAQRTYGADVISRIQYCSDHGHEALTQRIREQLASLISETCEASGVSSDEITYIAIAANTIMEHLAAGYSPVGMGIVPFAPISLFGEEMAAGSDLLVAENAQIYYAPAISSYVGGDITAG
ncbi:MAG: 2Fe-2S iron-sulfur cluster-binding protein, partial [Oscillospiraceae bacterium]|nr:2Fe-2S iron-sulfur cluster-binding protein [Oscillospiraceae bacterium]